MTQTTQVLFAFPSQAKLGRVVPKSKIYEHGQLASAQRDRFVAQVEQIRWAYKLAPETINLPARTEAPEIQVFDIELKGVELDDEVLRAIDRAIPFPIIFQLHRDRQIRMVAAFKRPSQAEVGQWVLGEYLSSPWLPAEAERQPLPMALDLQGLYEQLLRNLLPHPARIGESLAEQLERLARLRSRQSEYQKLEARLHREKQFNRKVVLNAQLRELKNEIDRLSA
ncbi:DUF4391 domain-containing protein [Azotobacter chroococcum]|uniref:DUF4391 domain-containing protein n=1 Tax=Azotobacter chroococcum TaxID=353 RepID=UPI0010AE826F|nr:DUF4391 domain-containing protein [Azotobacter chroococcum]TKD34378.1 DUF4391 domain-containing protein [Azotobacter chroococcum]